MPDPVARLRRGAQADLEPVRAAVLLSPAVLARIAVLLHGALLTAVWGYLAVRSFLNFQPDFDFLAYHFPFALMHLGLTSYLPMPHLLSVYRGFPPLGEWIEGVLVLLTGRPGAACTLGMLGLLIAIPGVRLVTGTRFSVRWYLTGLLAVPLVITHSGSGCVDLWGACALLLAFAAATRALDGGDDRRTLAGLYTGLVLAMLTKFTLWPFCALYGGGVLLALARRTLRGALAPRRLLAHAALLAVVLGALPLRNLIRFGNPTYPWQPPLAGRMLPGLPTSDFLDTNIPVYLHGSLPPRRFVESALELNRWRTSAPFFYTADQGRFPKDSPHFRMGGWFTGTVLWLCVFVPLAAAAERRPAGYVLTAISTAGLLAMQANNELRYWMFLPLTALFLVVRALPAMTPRTRGAAQAILLVLAASVGWQNRGIFLARMWSASEMVPPAARAFWSSQADHPAADGEIICVDGQMPWTVFWSGPTFREFRVQACH